LRELQGGLRELDAKLMQMYNDIYIYSQVNLFFVVEMLAVGDSREMRLERDATRELTRDCVHRKRLAAATQGKLLTAICNTSRGKLLTAM
jgi:hypothetical protein